MYQGHIVEVGEVLSTSPLEVRAAHSAAALAPGASVALDGVDVCVAAVDGDRITVQLSPETLRRSRFDGLRRGERLNVELPLRAGAPLQGHLVQGHVEALGKVVQVRQEAPGRRLWIVPPKRFLGSLQAKGSVAVDGVSLTVAEKLKDRFSIALVPATLARTTLGAVEVGRRVNLEADALAKLVAGADDPAAALRRAIAPRPWAGRVAGRAGVDKLVETLAAGGTVVVWDPDSEGEGDVIAAGHALRPETFTFFLTRACGHTTVPCDRDLLAGLGIPPMPGPGDHQGTAMHVPVDLAAAPGTGVSAADRARTVRRLAAPAATPGDFLMPGHVFPLAARPGRLAARQGHTEATVALVEAAGLPPVGICCEVMRPDGRMADAADLERFALRWGLPMIEIGALRRWL